MKAGTGIAQRRWDYIFAYVLIAPVMVYLVIFMVYPLIWALWTSLTNKTIGNNASFVGFKNFANLLQDKIFLRSIRNTVVYTVFAVMGKAILGVIMALILNAHLPAKNILRVLMFVPWTIPTLVSALTWKWMYSDIGGLFNFILMALGITHGPVPWLYDTHYAMFSIIIANIWRGTPFIGISVLAGLQPIPIDYYEAARIDGAGAVRSFFHITMPLIKEVVVLSTLITTIWTFNDFEIIWILTGGGPANATQILSTYGYTVGFMNLNLSKAISSSMFAIPFLVLLISLVMRRMGKTQEEG
ncbi:ABC transporter permease [Spirochaetia bacterium]|nr:ABC transporter permease [Spirochaetia bacterium]